MSGGLRILQQKGNVMTKAHKNGHWISEPLKAVPDITHLTFMGVMAGLLGIWLGIVERHMQHAPTGLIGVIIALTFAGVMTFFAAKPKSSHTYVALRGAQICYFIVCTTYFIQL
jgi:hypothetical protein